MGEREKEGKKEKGKKGKPADMKVEKIASYRQVLIYLKSAVSLCSQFPLVPWQVFKLNC